MRVKPSHVPKKAKFTVLFDDDVTITHDATEGWQMADRPIALPEQGSRVRVFWEGDGEWFVGTVRKTNPRMKMYNVFYESDGATVAHTCKEVWTPAVDEGEDDDGDTSAEEEEGRPKAGLKVELLSPKGKERKPVISGQSSTPASPDKVGDSIIFKGESLCLGGFADEAAALARRKRAEADRAAGRHPAPPRGKKRLLD